MRKSNFVKDRIVTDARYAISIYQTMYRGEYQQRIRWDTVLNNRQVFSTELGEIMDGVLVATEVRDGVSTESIISFYILTGSWSFFKRVVLPPVVGLCRQYNVRLGYMRKGRKRDCPVIHVWFEEPFDPKLFTF